MSIWCCLYVYNRADHLRVDNHSGGSSVGNPNSPPSVVIRCLWFFVCGWDPTKIYWCNQYNLVIQVHCVAVPVSLRLSQTACCGV